MFSLSWLGHQSRFTGPAPAACGFFAALPLKGHLLSLFTLYGAVPLLFSIIDYLLVLYYCKLTLVFVIIFIDILYGVIVLRYSKTNFFFAQLVAVVINLAKMRAPKYWSDITNSSLKIFKPFITIQIITQDLYVLSILGRCLLNVFKYSTLYI